MPNRSRKLTRKQAAQRTNLTEGTLANYASRRCGPPFVKIGKVLEYDEADLNAWIASRTIRVGFIERETA